VDNDTGGMSRALNAIDGGGQYDVLMTVFSWRRQMIWRGYSMKRRMAIWLANNDDVFSWSEENDENLYDQNSTMQCWREWWRGYGRTMTNVANGMASLESDAEDSAVWRRNLLNILNHPYITAAKYIENDFNINNEMTFIWPWLTLA
jgi:hypothetical protein